MSTERKCYSCGAPHNPKTDNLRPYGPNREDVCFDCAMDSTESRQTTERQYRAALDAIDGPAVLTPDGPKSVEDVIKDSTK